MSAKIQALIIDDDRDTAQFFNMVLNLVGYECSVAYSARTALAFLASTQPDIILLDMRLGLEVSGTDILYQIRANPRLENTRVIVVTAYPTLAEPVNYLADLVLIKPVEVEQLTALAARLSTIKPKAYSFRDPVTNLDQLPFFMTRLEHAFHRHKRRPANLFAVLVIGLEIEEPHDEDRQEALLKQAAGRLMRNFRPTDTFGRLDTTRIVALYEDLRDPQDVEIIQQRLRLELATPYDQSGESLEIRPRMGAALASEGFSSAEAMIETARARCEASVIS